MRGMVESRGDAPPLLVTAGDLVIVRRDRPRSAVFACPDACSEILTVNLDPRSGPAWSLYEGRLGITLFPSVWRESGCRSHFILWRSGIYWCNGDEEWADLEAQDDALAARVLAALSLTEVRSFVEVAHALGEIPWDVLGACRGLVRSGQAIGLRDRGGERFRRAR